MAYERNSILGSLECAINEDRIKILDEGRRVCIVKWAW